MVDIPVGVDLVFSRDETVKAKVAVHRNVEFNGEIVSLSVAADRAATLDAL